MNAQTSKRQLDEFSFESVFANNEAIANQVLLSTEMPFWQFRAIALLTNV